MADCVSDSKLQLRRRPSMVCVVGSRSVLVILGWLLLAVPTAAQDSPSPWQPPNLRLINPIPEPSAEAPGRSFAPPFTCPIGYSILPLTDLKICIPNDMTMSNCGGRGGVYSCGRNATECCAVAQDNPCFVGAYACSPGPSSSGPRHACCLR